MTVAFPVDETEPEVTFEPLAESDSEPLRCSEDGCTNPIHYSGRGRKPTKCAEHKRSGSGGRTASNKSAASGKSWPKATEVKSHLDAYRMPINLALLATANVTKDPAFVRDAAIIEKQLPVVNAELVELAKDDKDLQRVLEAIALPSKYAPISMAIMGLVMPILVNHGLAPSFMIPAQNAPGSNDNGMGGEQQ